MLRLIMYLIPKKCRGINVLDTGNEQGVFSDTGTAEYSLYRNEDLKTFRGDIRYLNENYNRPDFYNEPRRMVLGVRYNF